jgi:hypothetical protein
MPIDKQFKPDANGGDQTDIGVMLGEYCYFGM